jgi:tRNA U34 5-methylaminomethyl-2-thiouridine-forming methyltransferase MnmC
MVVSTFAPPAFWDSLEVVLTHDGSRTLRIPGSEVTFHSTSGAVTESREVFLRNSRCLQRLSDRPTESVPFRVLEIGFGTGLNFLLAADHAIRQSSSIEYTAFENRLVPPAMLRELGFEGLVDSPELVPWLEALIEDIWRGSSERNGEFPKMAARRSFITPGAGLVELDLRLEDYLNARLPNQFFDAIFLDAFGPETSAGSWDKSFAVQLRQSLKREGRLATYCVKRDVQKAFREAGFSIEVVSGPAGGKRQVMIASAE